MPCTMLHRGQVLQLPLLQQCTWHVYPGGQGVVLSKLLNVWLYVALVLL